MTKIQVKRVYDDPIGTVQDDGYRIYVDRLWPRGESKEKFHYDMWAKDIAPSTQLREWFHMSPDSRWEEFRQRYIAELDRNPAVKKLLDEIRAYKCVTLLFSSRNKDHNNADVLKEYLSERLTDK